MRAAVGGAFVSRSGAGKGSGLWTGDESVRGADGKPWSGQRLAAPGRRRVVWRVWVIGGRCTGRAVRIHPVGWLRHPAAVSRAQVDHADADAPRTWLPLSDCP